MPSKSCRTVGGPEGPCLTPGQETWITRPRERPLRLYRVTDKLRDMAETEIARSCMAQWFEPAPLPQTRAAAGGDPMLLVTDHHRVHDSVVIAAMLTA